MGVKIGTVFMDLRAASKHLRGDIRKAMRNSKKEFAAAAKDIAKIATSSFAVATTALTAATVKGLKAVDDLAKTSDKLNIATESLQAFRHAAELTGTSATTLDMGIQRMTRRISEAAQGSGEAQNAIRELGLEAVKLNALSIDQQFLAISDAMKQVKNSGDQVRLTQKLFDSEGVALVNTLRLGREGLENARKELDALGVSISRIDAAKVERANDAMLKLGQAFTGISNRLAVELAPLIENVSNKMLDMAKSGNLVGKSVANSMEFVGGIATAIDNIVHIGKGAVAAFGGAIGAIGFNIFNLAEGLRKLFSGILAVAKVVFPNIGTIARHGFLKAKEAALEFVNFLVSKLSTARLTILDTFQDVADAIGIPFDSDAARIKINEQTLTIKKALGNQRKDVKAELEKLRPTFVNIVDNAGTAWRNATSKATEGSLAMWRDTFKIFGQDMVKEFEDLVDAGMPGLRVTEWIQKVKAGSDQLLNQIEQTRNDIQSNALSFEIPIQFSIDKSLESIRNAPAQALEGFRREYDLLALEFREGVISLDQFTQGLNRAKESVREAEQVFNSTRTSTELYHSEIARLNDLLDRGLITQETYNRAIADTARKYDLTRRPVEAVRKATERYRQTIKKLREDLSAGKIGQDQFADASEEAAKKLQKTEEQIQSHLNHVQDQWAAVNRNIEHSIDTLVEHGKFSFKDFANSIVKDLAKIHLRRALIGDGLGGTGSGGLLGGIFTGLKSILPGFASGGRPEVGMPSIVGEKGPELFIPDNAGTVIPNNITKALLKKVQSPAMSVRSTGPTAQSNAPSTTINEKVIKFVLNQENHFERGMGPQEIAEMLNEYGQQHLKVLVDLVDRGGDFRRAIQS